MRPGSAARMCTNTAASGLTPDLFRPRQTLDGMERAMCGRHQMQAHCMGCRLLSAVRQGRVRRRKAGNCYAGFQRSSRAAPSRRSGPPPDPGAESSGRFGLRFRPEDTRQTRPLNLPKIEPASSGQGRTQAHLAETLLQRHRAHPP